MNWFYEVAIGSPNKRGTLIPVGEMPDIVKQNGQNNAIYRSVYMYPESALQVAEQTGSIKTYTGIRNIEFVPIDIDKGSDTDEELFKRTLAIINTLEYKYNLDERNFTCYFSGTGFHIDIHANVFNFKPSEDLPYIVKTTMLNLFGNELDPSVYSRTGLYRMNYSRNQKTGLYKTAVTREDIERMDMKYITELATYSPESWQAVMDEIMELEIWEYTMGQSQGHGELASKVVTNVPSIRTFDKVTEPLNVATCIQTLYNAGPKRGNRNLVSLRIASHFKRSGIPSVATKAALLEWNSKSLNENIIIEHVENVYNRNYKYGCEDTILKKYCNTRCIYYKNKDYSAQMYTAEDMQKMAEERQDTDFSGRVLDIAEMLGIPEKDCIIYPGELVTIMGPTGCGKTAFAQHLVLGINMKTGDINPKRQLDTIYMSLELSPPLMHRRNLQMVSNLSKQVVTKNLQKVYADNKQWLDHIKLRTVSGEIKDIEEFIRQLTPRVVVVDYLDLVEAEKRNEHEQIKAIAHGLSSLAVRYDIIIIAIAQVRREDARDNFINLYSGKGSGAIENASRKVIGITGQAHDPLKSVAVLKNTDGELLEAEIIHNGSTLRFSTKET